ncbi:hypothetical protein KUTeg_001415 [Tegillarca granosa]|uniref:Uncharacterized protein n=1 Tax=Tegillarca granosa TaxID=220873 RepID=A0ABQ9FVW0_TEGGR|nr:hypothetical protein KUTeg_001415 [Tegillarca granosa]
MTIWIHNKNYEIKFKNKNIHLLLFLDFTKCIIIFTLDIHFLKVIKIMTFKMAFNLSRKRNWFYQTSCKCFDIYKIVTNLVKTTYRKVGCQVEVYTCNIIDRKPVKISMNAYIKNFSNKI